MELRPYQVSAVEELRARIRSGAKRPLLIMPTGGGKTVVFCDVVQRAVSKGSRALIIAHRRELVAQASGKLLSFGVSHGIIQAGFQATPHREVQVASIQTLMARTDRMPRANLVVIDEAHHFTEKNSYAKVLAHFPNAVVLGVTATPWRLDGQGLSDVFDAHVVATTPRELRDEGFLVPVGGWEYEPIDTSQARVKNGDFVAADLNASATSRRVVGDIVSEYQLHCGGARAVLFAVSIEHSMAMVAEFLRAGVRAEHIDGEMPVAARDQVLARLRAGETQVVCNCNVLTEGFDCPELEVVILARPTLSTSLYLQMVGRGLRPAPGKTGARIHDHAGCLAAHGHPYMERDYSPQSSSRAERKDVEERAKLIRRCTSCKSVIARWPCDSCGYSPTPKELQVEYEKAARRREITNDDSGTAPKRSDQQERRDVWRREFVGDEERKLRFFHRMVEKHGVEKGTRTYAWFTGFLESAPAEWVQEARRRELERIKASLEAKSA